MNKLVVKAIPYPRCDVKDFFAPLSSLDWSILLESGSSTHIDSRYHILSADPVATLVTESVNNPLGPDTTITTISQGNEITTSTAEPFSLLDSTLNRVIGNIDDHESELPFLAGALGYFGYDLGRTIESINTIAQDDLSFPDMAVGLYDWAIVLDTHTQEAWQIQFSANAEDDFQSRQAWLIAQGIHNSQPTTEFTLTDAWQANMTEVEYKAKFAQIQAYLQSGDCYQINLAQRFKNQYQGDEWLAYYKLSQFNQAPFSAFMRLAGKAVLSISPERFIQLKGDVIETKPIKGTRPRSDVSAIDDAYAHALQTATKDRAENLMIVDLLRNDIGKIATAGSVSVPHLFAIESFPAVHHLVSTIVGKLPAANTASELLRACFPGGSITGAPKIRAMDIIEELEPHRRSLYCGSMGYISAHGNMDTSITIRTLLCEKNTIYCWAGGGIVADSVDSEEYQETYDKLGKILPVL